MTRTKLEERAAIAREHYDVIRSRYSTALWTVPAGGLYGSELYEAMGEANDLYWGPESLECDGVEGTLDAVREGCVTVLEAETFLDSLIEGLRALADPWRHVAPGELGAEPSPVQYQPGTRLVVGRSKRVIVTVVDACDMPDGSEVYTVRTRNHRDVCLAFTPYRGWVYGKAERKVSVRDIP